MNNKTLLTASAGAFVACFSAAASAQKPAPAQQSDAHVYAYFAGGASQLRPNKGDLDAILRSAGATTVTSSFRENDSGYKAQLGYMFNRYLGIEGGWVDLGTFLYDATFTGGSLRTETRINGLNVSGLAAWPVLGRLSLLARVGALYAETRTSPRTRSGTTAFATSATDRNWIANVGLGASFQINRNLAVRAEAERFRYAGNPGTTGQGDVNFYSLGVGFAFR